MKTVFQLEKHNTTIPAEILAGTTSFLTLSYALAINPLILKEAGMPFGGVFVATAFASGFCAILLGLVANVPFGMGPGMGVNALLAQTVCLKLGFAWQEALCIACFSSILHTFLVSGAHGRTIVRHCIPEYLRYAAAVGIGSFCTVGGFHYSGLLRHVDSSAQNVAFDISQHATGATPIILQFSHSHFVALVGILVIVVLLALEKKNNVSYAAFSLGILVSTFVGIPLGVTSLASLYSFDASVFAKHQELVFAFLGDPGLMSLVAGPPMRTVLAMFIGAVICLLTVTDSIASVTGLGSLPINPVFSEKEMRFEAETLENGEAKEPRFQKTLIVNSLGGSIASALGCSPVNCYVESCLGVASRGRTGLTAVVTGILFLATVPLVELVEVLPAEAVGSALVMCGCVIITLVKKIDWNDVEQAVPSGLAILLMIATNNFLSGMALGMGCHVAMQLVAGKRKQLNPVTVAAAALLTAMSLTLYVLQRPA